MLPSEPPPAAPSSRVPVEFGRQSPGAPVEPENALVALEGRAVHPPVPTDARLRVLGPEAAERRDHALALPGGVHADVHFRRGLGGNDIRSGSAPDQAHIHAHPALRGRRPGGGERDPGQLGDRVDPPLRIEPAWAARPSTRTSRTPTPRREVLTPPPGREGSITRQAAERAASSSMRARLAALPVSSSVVQRIVSGRGGRRPERSSARSAQMVWTSPAFMS